MTQRSGYVKYLAPTELNQRQISKQDWATVGIDHETVTWDRSNNWRVPASNISDEAWPHIEADTGLRYVPEEEGTDGAQVPKSKVRRAGQSSDK